MEVDLEEQGWSSRGVAGVATGRLCPYNPVADPDLKCLAHSAPR